MRPGDMVLWHTIHGEIVDTPTNGAMRRAVKHRGVIMAELDEGLVEVAEGGMNGPRWNISTSYLLECFEPAGGVEVKPLTFDDEVRAVCSSIAEMLIEKNASYGDSVLNPMPVFSKLSADERIGVRMDDKISRMARGHSFPGDNDLRDLVGYIVLKLVKSERDAREKASPARFEPAPIAALAS